MSNLNESYLVKIDAFEGPLDLLLHLINEYEIDIYDIPVAEITDQYNEYIKTMQQLELNIASEYLVMAATLLAIKSQMLLPKQQIEEDIDTYEEDPREELIKRLIEYRKFKNSAEMLKEKEDEANEVFMRSPTIFNEEFYKPEIKQGNQSIYDMLRAFDRMLIRKKWDEPLETTVTRVEIPIEQRMQEVLETVKANKSGIMFDHLFVERTRTHIVVTFMAILELMKNNSIYCQQERNFDVLYLYSFSHSS